MTFELGLELEVNERYLEAAAVYEELLVRQPTCKTLTELVVLYWYILDQHVSAFLGLNAEKREPISARLWQLLRSTSFDCESSTEFRFWRRYIAWDVLGDEFDPEECRAMLEENPASALPSLYLFQIGRRRDYREAAQRLLDEARSRPTAGNLYVVSVLGPALTRSVP